MPSPVCAIRAGKRGGALDQVIIGGLGSIGSVLPEAEYAGIDQPRIELRDHVVAELQPRHRLRADVVDQYVARGDQLQHDLTSRRLLQIEADAALAAIGIEEHRSHAGMTDRSDQPGHVAFQRLDLDDIGAIVAEHLGGIGSHQHRRHVDDLDALQRTHGRDRSRGATSGALLFLVTARAREIKGPRPSDACGQSNPMRSGGCCAHRAKLGRADGVEARGAPNHSPARMVSGLRLAPRRYAALHPGYGSRIPGSQGYFAGSSSET